MPSEHLPPASPVILLVEDDVLLRWVTADSLRESGFVVIEAANSAEAVRVMEATSVDALFSDIDMPGRMNGLALGAMGPSAPIQYQDHTDFGCAEAPGRRRKYASFLPKPYADDQVEHLLRSVLPSP